MYGDSNTGQHQTGHQQVLFKRRGFFYGSAALCLRSAVEPGSSIHCVYRWANVNNIRVLIEFCFFKDVFFFQESSGVGQTSI